MFLWASEKRRFGAKKIKWHYEMDAEYNLEQKELYTNHTKAVTTPERVWKNDITDRKFSDVLWHCTSLRHDKQWIHLHWYLCYSKTHQGRITRMTWCHRESFLGAIHEIRYSSFFSEANPVTSLLHIPPPHFSRPLMVVNFPHCKQSKTTTVINLEAMGG